MAFLWERIDGLGMRSDVAANGSRRWPLVPGDWLTLPGRTALRVQGFDKGRGPVGLPPIGQACQLPAWPDQGPRGAASLCGPAVLPRSRWPGCSTRSRPWPGRGPPAARCSPGHSPWSGSRRPTNGPWRCGKTTAIIGREEGQGARFPSKDTAPEGHLTHREKDRQNLLTQRGFRSASSSRSGGKPG